MTTQAYSQRHLISVAELASAIATARGTAGIDELRELARQAEDGTLAALPLYPPHQRWQHRGDVNRIGVPTENPVVIWRMLAAKVCKPHLSDKDAFNYPPAASTWHMLAADVYGLGMTRSLNRRAAAALRELAIRYSPELGDDEAELLKPVTNAAEPEVPPAPQPVPVVQPEAHAATALRETPMSRAGLVKAHIHHWPTIEADLKDAARNGLSVTKAGERSWSENKALEWARAKGKLTDQPGASSQPSLADPMAAHYGQLAGLPRQTHTL